MELGSDVDDTLAGRDTASARIGALVHDRGSAGRGLTVAGEPGICCGALLAHEARRVDGYLHGEMPVDQRHPVFFDHPLDHVPGILMLTGMLDRVRAARGPRAAARISASFTFPRFAELDAPLAVDIEALPAVEYDAWSAVTTQRAGTVASALVTFEGTDLGAAHGSADPAAAAAYAERARPAPAELVHRANPDNILLGAPRRTDIEVRTTLLNPPSGHFFTRRDPVLRTAEEITEGARQLAIMLWQFEYGRETEVQLLLDAVRIDLPLALRRDEPVELRWTLVPRRGTKGVFSVNVHAPARGGAAGLHNGSPIGVAVIETRAMGRHAYLRLRATTGSVDVTEPGAAAGSVSAPGCAGPQSAADASARHALVGGA